MSAPDTIAVLRESWRGKVWTARPFRVVLDTPALIALHMMPGSVCKHPKGAAEFLPDEWTLSDRPWVGGDMLCLHQPGRWQAVWLFWSPPPERRFLRWYVNLQEPLRRTRLGFDYLDQELDLVIEADRSWYWKDEAAFRSAASVGCIIGMGLWEATRPGGCIGRLFLSRRELQRARAAAREVPAFEPLPTFDLYSLLCGVC